MSGERASVSHAVALGLIQGPAELLPISSSSHTALIPWLMRWRSAGLDVEARRSLEVALHAGTAAALLAGGARLGPHRLRTQTMLLATAPPAVAGYLLERFIDRRLSSPRTIAVGLMAGAACMAASDRASRKRRAQDAGALDGLLLGAAQVLALAPGVSRNGATLAVARARGFGGADADLLSWQVGLPVIAGAAALKLSRERRRPTPPGTRRAMIAGAATAFASTLAGERAIGLARSAAAGSRRKHAEPAQGGTGRLAPYAAYRIALAALVMRRLREEGGGATDGGRRTLASQWRRAA